MKSVHRIALLLGRRHSNPEAISREGGSIKLEKLPEAAASAIKKWAGEGRITKIVKETHSGSSVYEAAASGPGDARREVSVDGEGR